MNSMKIQDSIENQSETTAMFELETPPKWIAIKQTIKDIQASFAKKTSTDDTVKNFTPPVCRLLVITKQIQTFQQLLQVLV
jgi:hypothetical protein